MATQRWLEQWRGSVYSQKVGSVDQIVLVDINVDMLAAGMGGAHDDEHVRAPIGCAILDASPTQSGDFRPYPLGAVVCVSRFYNNIAVPHKYHS